MKVNLGILIPDRYRAKYSLYYIKGIKVENEDGIDENHIFFNKQVVFTQKLCMPKKEAIQQVI